MEHVEFYIELLARLIDWLAIGVLFYGFVIAIVPFLIIEFRWLFSNLKRAGGDKGNKDKAQLIDEQARRPLARYLLFGLELLIVSDIIHTTISRTLDDLLFLGGVVIIRTVLSYFLNKELIHLDGLSLKKKRAK